ncbi:MAG: HDOD domain-containing protein [Cyanobacteria bacterium SIG28]|nr:HDOD domain-containing protein [Cyanobacteria bacterium SIG28]
MDKTIELVNSIKDIQAMPSVIVKVLNVMKKPTVSMKELGDIVVYDQSLTIKILALVNSAYYGFSQQISSISIALSLLGMVKVKNIIVAVAMKPMMSNSGDKELWKHSMRVAAGCEYLAKMTKIMDADEAFIIGFIHDIGKIVLHTSNPKLYNKVIECTKDGADILDVEKNYFDSDHVKTGSLLAKRWQLPILLANIISYHHNPSLSSIPVPCNLVSAADKLVQDNFNPNTLDKDFFKTLGIDLNDVESLREVILQKADLLISELT